jgi:hypothetical protein
MGIGGTSADVRMLNFYRRLVERNFSDVAKEIQQALDVHRLMDLHGTRVLDKLMMLRGADPTWRENTVTRCRDFLHLLPDAWRQKVEEAAECVAQRVDTSHLLNGTGRRGAPSLGPDNVSERN